MIHPRTTVPMLRSNEVFLPARLLSWLLAALLALLGHGILAPAPARAQPVEWKQLQVTARFGHAMAYDSVRGVTVLFGGTAAGTANGETWEYNGTSWTQKALSGPSPSPRFDHAMAYDVIRGVTVLFGGDIGTGQSGDNGETWEWNGSTWTQRAASGPSPRYAHAMTYDAARGVIVLFGGFNHAGIQNGETWEWNGATATWILRDAGGAGRPSPRHSHAMAYDAARGVTVLFGGSTNSNSTVNGETWEWNGATWTLRDAGGIGRPLPRFRHAMAYDAARGVTILFGGRDNIDYGDTWEWNGTSWTQRVVTGPTPRRHHAIVYDAARNRTVLFGGYSTSNLYDAETWEWNGTGGGTWTQRTFNGPSPRESHAMAYDSAPNRQVTVLFGGTRADGGPVSGDTWEWNGTAWTEKHPPDSPLSRYGHAMVYDSAPSRQVTVLFGGVRTTAYLDDTWEWNGTAWTQRNVAGPSPRHLHAMAYDSARGVTVLFGGWTNGTYFGDTWEWNGNVWTQRMVPGPAPRYSLGMAYDSDRHVTVLFGGYTVGNVYNGETWEWDGSMWMQKANSGPSPRQGLRMAYDSIRGVIVLFGGDTAIGLNGETWEWNGTAWTQRMVNGPTPRHVYAMTYDVARSTTVLFGGYNTAPYGGDTWGLLATCTTASFTAQPTPTATCPTGPAGFDVTASGPGTLMYQWQYRSGPNNPDPLAWTNLVNGRNPAVGPFRLNVTSNSARTRLLVVDHDPTPWPDPTNINNPVDDHIPYLFRCVATNACGPATSVEAALSITSVCVADVDDGSGHGTPDCGVTIDDLLYYLFIFEQGSLAADIDDGSSTGTPDGGVTIDDLIYYLQRFEAGC